MDIEEQNELDMFEEVGENWDESDIRSLIAHVKANQFLVNKSERDFKNKEKKDDAWKIIAMLLNKSETEVQKKWKSLRTVFSRKLGQLKQKMPSGSGADAKGKISRIEWEYWGDMQFLIPHIRHKFCIAPHTNTK
ncbi:transcription factor Adf-1-like isoform X3 [Temnothorax americanus]|uniref:transcription factor Adf-1-like isoform X3 n=1 Tax=Temnothorax americanus TaxID=1964332 RepID=UPI004067EBDE